MRVSLWLDRVSFCPLVLDTVMLKWVRRDFLILHREYILDFERSREKWLIIVLGVNVLHGGHGMLIANKFLLVLLRS